MENFMDIEVPEFGDMFDRTIDAYSYAHDNGTCVSFWKIKNQVVFNNANDAKRFSILFPEYDTIAIVDVLKIKNI